MTGREGPQRRSRNARQREGAMSLHDVLVFLFGFAVAFLIVAVFVVVSFLGGASIINPEGRFREHTRHGGPEE